MNILYDEVMECGILTIKRVHIVFNSVCGNIVLWTFIRYITTSPVDNLYVDAHERSLGARCGV